MSNILRDIYIEMRRQQAKHGEQDHSDEWWLPIILEELGETAKAMLEVHFEYPDAKVEDIRKELIETVATGFSWLECMEKRGEI